MPPVKVLAFSGFTLGLPPVVMLAWPALGFWIEPIDDAGAPCARQTARRLALVVGAAPAHGSAARLVSVVVTGENSSPMFGARTAR